MRVLILLLIPFLCFAETNKTIKICSRNGKVKHILVDGDEIKMNNGQFKKLMKDKKLIKDKKLDHEYFAQKLSVELAGKKNVKFQDGTEVTENFKNKTAVQIYPTLLNLFKNKYYYKKINGEGQQEELAADKPVKPKKRK